jgi:hypothetical protein
MPGAIINLLARRVPSRAQVIRAIWLVSAIALGLQVQNGADFGRYAQWPKAFATSEILKIPSTVLSPVGVPMTHWSHAPGLITDALSRILSVLPAVQINLHTAAWFAAMAFWWAMIGLVRMATHRDPALFVLALAAAFIGTHAGFYSIYHSSEIFALSTLAVSVYWALTAKPERVRDSLIVGVVTGLLLIVRVNLIMYVVLPLATRAIIVWRGYGNRFNKALFLHALAIGVPLLVYGVQLMLFNYWATGVPSRSPYVYGDSGFKSVDFAHPMFGTMLFHSWHGLVTYHPLFLLGPIALIALIVSRAVPIAERVLAGYALFAVCAQFYVQASWWCWWNGTGTYGNRTLAVAGVVLIVALARWWYLLEQRGTRLSQIVASVALTLTAAACVWSFLLYIQGHTNYVTWRELLQEQRRQLREPSNFVPLGIAALLSLGFGAVAFRRLRMRAIFAAFAVFVASLAAQGLLAAVVRDWATRWEVPKWTTPSLAIVSALVFAVVAYVAIDGQPVPNPLRRARTVVAGGLLAVFVVGTYSFSQLAIATKKVIATGAANSRKYHFRAPMVIDDLLGCIPEYDRVEGFAARKAAFRRFIEAEVIEARRRIKEPPAAPPGPIQPS